MPDNPFTDPTAIRGHLYDGPTRLARRSEALYAAKVEGANAAATLAELITAVAPGARTLVDVGGGSGPIARHLARRFPSVSVILLDQAAALLRDARQRLAAVGNVSTGVCGDFHRLPLRPGSVDVAVAAFCIYHSRRPQAVIEEIAACLSPAGRAVLATKSADSYRELDELVARSGLDPQAEERPGLYDTFHSTNAAEVVGSVLHVERELHEQHVFRFADLDHLATYLATSPKYRMPALLAGDPTRLAGELRRRLPEQPFTMTSTVTYVAAAWP